MLKKVFLITILVSPLLFTKVNAAYTCDKTVNPGQNIATVANSASAGQTVCIKEGTYTLGSGGSYKITQPGINIVSHPNNSKYPVIKSLGPVF